MNNNSSKSLFSDIEKIPPILKESYIPSLNGFRTISIAFVIFGHILGTTTNPILKHLVEVRSLGVYIFFVISGFLITTLLLKEKIKTGDISLTNFYKRRILRIVPLAYLYPVVLLILNYTLKLHIPLLAFVGPFIFLSNVGFFNRSGYLGHYWSLAFEEQFYLFFPIILKKNFKLYIIFLISLLVAIIIIRQYEYDFGPMKGKSALYYFQYLLELIRYLDGIIIGSFLSILTFKNMLPVDFFRRYKWLVNLTLMPLIIIIHCKFINTGVSTVNSIIVSVLVAIVIITNIQRTNGIFFKFLNNKFISYIGVMSYSIYIWQELFTFPKKPLFGGRVMYADTIWFNLTLLAIISYVSYNFYEKQFLKLKNRIKQ